MYALEAGGVPMSVIRRRCLFVTLALLGATPARAERFGVSATVVCPASWDQGLNRLETTFTIRPAIVPCAGIRVVAMDADPGPDEYCGAGFTDSQGFVRIAGECNDRLGGRPEVYVKVTGRSINGFSVGILDPTDPLHPLTEALEHGLEAGVPLGLPVVDALRAHATFEWVGPERLAGEGQQLDLGEIGIGAGGALSWMAARQLWIAQYTAFRLREGTQHQPMDFNYSLNAPIGFPTTLYDTVIVDSEMNEAPAASRALRATAHEIGHVLYNTYHSGMLHWLLDAPDYMTQHGRCEAGHFQTLAWYEGFANFVRDYVFQRWDWRASTWTEEFEPFSGCALTTGQVDMSLEGNVQGMLNNIFFGPVRQAQRDGIGVPQNTDFSCPAGQRRVVNSDGTVECEREEAPTCTRGAVTVDRVQLIDQCARSVRDPGCEPFEECEPVLQFSGTVCTYGDVVRRSGPDGCIARSPARHSLPNGQPAPRPDGTPDMVLGRTPGGGLAWFSLPDLDDVVEWVIRAGNDGHRAREFWQGWIRPWCQTRDALRNHYCDPNRSATFLGELQTLDPAFN
jgi:hypothetical protein